MLHSTLFPLITITILNDVLCYNIVDVDDILSDNLMPGNLLMFDNTNTSKILGNVEMERDNLTRSRGSFDDAFLTMGFHRSKMNEYLCRNFIAEEIVSKMSVSKISRRSGASALSAKEDLMIDEGSKSYKDWLSKSTTLEDIYRHYNTEPQRKNGMRQKDEEDEEYDTLVTNYVYEQPAKHTTYNLYGTSGYNLASYPFNGGLYDQHTNNYGTVSLHNYDHVQHDNSPKFNKEKDLTDLFDIALTALAYLSFGMFIIHVVMCISAVSNSATTMVTVMPMNMGPAAPEPTEGMTPGNGMGGDMTMTGGEMTGNGGDMTGNGGESMTGNGGEMTGNGGEGTTGNGGESMTGNGGEMTGNGGEGMTGNGDDMTGNGDDMTGNGGEMTGNGGEMTGNGGDMTGNGGEMTGNGDEMTGNGGDGMTGNGGEGMSENGGEMTGNGGEMAGNGDDGMTGNGGDGMTGNGGDEMTGNGGEDMNGNGMTENGGDTGMTGNGGEGMTGNGENGMTGNGGENGMTGNGDGVTGTGEGGGTGNGGDVMTGNGVTGNGGDDVTGNGENNGETGTGEGVNGEEGRILTKLNDNLRKQGFFKVEVEDKNKFSKSETAEDGERITDNLNFRYKREILSNNREINEVARKILTSIEAALVAESDDGVCLRKQLCENNKYSRSLENSGKIWIPVWSLGMSWLSGRLIKNVPPATSMLDGLKASILGLGKANCDIIYKECNLYHQKMKQKRRRRRSINKPT